MFHFDLSCCDDCFKNVISRTELCVKLDMSKVEGFKGGHLLSIYHLLVC